MIYEAGREVGVSLFLLPADPLAVELLGGGPLGGLVVLEHGLRGAAEGAQAMMGEEKEGCVLCTGGEEGGGEIAAAGVGLWSLLESVRALHGRLLPITFFRLRHGAEQMPNRPRTLPEHSQSTQRQPEVLGTRQ